MSFAMASYFRLDLQLVRSIITALTRHFEVPRLSRTERVILDLLRDEETFGLALVERSKGRLKRGTVYVTLARMQEKGYVESRTEARTPGAIGLPRRLYRPTGYGLRVFDAWTLAARTIRGHRPQEA
jgi:PadR family transcriptional regulator PadR